MDDLAQFHLVENAPLREVEKFGLTLPSTRQTQSKRSVASAERLRPLQFIRGSMKKTRVYIDGYNLYYGLLKGTPWKWLDLELFSKGLLNPDHEIVSIDYFTAPVKTHAVF